MYSNSYFKFLLNYEANNLKFVSQWDWNFYESDDWYEDENYWLWLMINYKYSRDQKLYSFRYGCLVDDYFSDNDIDFNISNKFHSILYLLNFNDENFREVERFRRLNLYANNLLNYDRFCNFIDFYFFQLGFFKRDLYIIIGFSEQTHIYTKLRKAKLLLERRRRNKDIIFRRQRITKEEREACRIARLVCMVQAGIVRRTDYSRRLALATNLSRVKPEFLYTCFSYSTGRINNRYYKEVIEWQGFQFRDSFLRFIKLPTTEPVYFSHYTPVDDLHKYRRYISELDEWRWQEETINLYYRESKSVRRYRWSNTFFYMYPRISFKLLRIAFYFKKLNFVFNRFFYWVYYKKIVPDTMYYGLYHSWIFSRVSFMYANLLNRFRLYYNFLKFKFWNLKKIKEWPFVFKFKRIFNDFYFHNFFNIYSFKYFSFFCKKKKNKNNLYLRRTAYIINIKKIFSLDWEKKFKRIFFKVNSNIFYFFYNSSFIPITRRLVLKYFLVNLFVHSNNRNHDLTRLSSYKYVYLSFFLFNFFTIFNFYKYSGVLFFFVKRFHYIKQWWYRLKKRLKIRAHSILINLNFWVFLYRFCFIFFTRLNNPQLFTLKIFQSKAFFCYLKVFIFQSKLSYQNLFFLFFFIRYLFFSIYYLKCLMYIFISFNNAYLIPVYEGDSISEEYEIKYGLSNWIWWILEIFNHRYYGVFFFWKHMHYYKRLALITFLDKKWLAFYYYNVSFCLYLVFFRSQTEKFIIDHILSGIGRKLNSWKYNIFNKFNIFYFTPRFSDWYSFSFFLIAKFYNYLFFLLGYQALLYSNDIANTCLDFSAIFFTSIFQLISNFKIFYIKLFYFKTYIHKFKLIEKFFFFISTIFLSKIELKYSYFFFYYLNAGLRFSTLDCSIRELWFNDLEYLFFDIIVEFYPIQIFFFYNIKFFSIKNFLSFFSNFNSIFYYKQLSFFKSKFYLRYLTLKRGLRMQRYSLSLWATGMYIYIYKRYLDIFFYEIDIYKCESRTDWSLLQSRSKTILNILFEDYVWPRFLFIFFSKVYERTDIMNFYILLFDLSKRELEMVEIYDQFSILDLYFSTLKKNVKRQYRRYFIDKYSDLYLVSDWVAVIADIYSEEFNKIYKRRKRLFYVLNSIVLKKKSYRRIYKSLTTISYK